MPPRLNAYTNTAAAPKARAQFLLLRKSLSSSLLPEGAGAVDDVGLSDP